LTAEKTATGYTPREDGTPYRQAGRALQATGIHCQLLNPITERESIPGRLHGSVSIISPQFSVKESPFNVGGGKKRD